MSGYLLKPPHAPVTFLVDWRRGHLAPHERVARDLGWTVQSRRPGEPPLEVAEQDHDRARSWAVFVGGAPGGFYLVTNSVRTDDERVLRRAVVVRIAAGGSRSKD